MRVGSKERTAKWTAFFQNTPASFNQKQCALVLLETGDAASDILTYFPDRHKKYDIMSLEEEVQKKLIEQLKCIDGASKGTSMKLRYSFVFEH